MLDGCGRVGGGGDGEGGGEGCGGGDGEGGGEWSGEGGGDYGAVIRISQRKSTHSHYKYNCTSSDIRRTLYSVQCTRYTVYGVHCTPYSVYDVNCTSYSDTAYTVRRRSAVV